MIACRPFAKRFRRLTRRLLADNRAATAIEYGLIAALVVIASMVALIQVADTTTGMWTDVSEKVTNAH